MKRASGIIAAMLLAGVACAAPSTEGERGAQLFRQCIACHALEPGRGTPAGPTLHNIVGRSIATEPGFTYSPAMGRFAASRGRWTPDLLDRFLANPETVVPGTEMGFVGMADSGDRRALIAWLAAEHAGGR